MEPPSAGRLFTAPQFFNIFGLLNSIAHNEGSINQPEITAVTFRNLALDGAREILVLSPFKKAVKNAAVAFFIFPWWKSFLSPLELHGQMKMSYSVNAERYPYSFPKYESSCFQL